MDLNNTWINVSRRKPMKCLFALALICLVSSQALAFSKGELACFEKADDKNFQPPVVEPRYRVLTGYRQCQPRKFGNKNDWFNCLVKRARPSRRIMQVFRIENLPDALAMGNWGNLGWARQNVFVIPSFDSHFENASLIARGIESSDILDGQNCFWTERWIEDHDRYTFENRCINRTKRCRRKGAGCLSSFNEVQHIPNGKFYSIDFSECR